MPDDFFNVTGAAHNYTRKTASNPSSVRKRTQRGSAAASSAAKNGVPIANKTTSLPLTPLQLDLENFDDPRYEESRYVLTSPRSLDACAKLGVKPVDLLYKSLQDYEEDHPNWSVKELFQLYEDEEEKRRETLKQARQIRNRIIEEEKTKKAEEAVTNTKSKGSTRGVSGIPPTPDSVKNGLPARKPSKQLPVRASSCSPGARPTASHQRSILKRSSSSSSLNRRASPNPIQRSVSFESLHGAGSARAGSDAGSTDSVTRRRAAERERLLARVERLTNEEDRKRLLLLIEKSEQDISQNDTRRESQIQREEDLMRDRFQQEIKDTAYRRQVAVSDYQWRKNQNELRCELETAEVEQQKKLEQSIKEKEAAHERLLEIQRRQQEQQIWERRREEEKRRLRVSSNLAEAEAQLTHYQESVRSHSDDSIRATALRKLKTEVTAQQRKRLENVMRQEAFRYRKFQMERQHELESDDVRRNMEIRDSVVDLNQRQLASEKRRIQQAAQRERKQRETAVNSRRQKLDAEREDYQRQLKAYKEQSMNRASDRLDGRMSETANRLHQRQSEKNQQHREKLDELRRVEAEWQKETAQLLHQKEARARLVQMEREEKMRETREAAYTAERLREEIRKAYEVDSFDRKLNHTTLLNKMGLGGSSQLA